MSTQLEFLTPEVEAIYRKLSDLASEPVDFLVYTYGRKTFCHDCYLEAVNSVDDDSNCWMATVKSGMCEDCGVEAG